MSEQQMMAQAVKTFYGEEGPKNPASAPFPVSRARFADLAANGLVIEVGATEDAAVPTAADAPAGNPGSEPAEVTAETKSGRGTRAK
jgi:hypothetical protein